MTDELNKAIKNIDGIPSMSELEDINSGLFYRIDDEYNIK